MFLGKATNIKITIQYEVDEEYWKDGESHMFKRVDIKDITPFKSANVYYGDED